MRRGKEEPGSMMYFAETWWVVGVGSLRGIPDFSISFAAVQPSGADLRPEHLALLTETDLSCPPRDCVPPLSSAGSHWLCPLPSGISPTQPSLLPPFPADTGRTDHLGCLHIPTEERQQTCQAKNPSLTQLHPVTRFLNQN